jgi:protoheme IX farnesyltransferase
MVFISAVPSIAIPLKIPKEGRPLDAWSYVEISKPKLVFLLVITSLGAMFVASIRADIPLTLSQVVFGSLTAILGSAGCNVLTSYIDRDVDALMDRTRKRPLPSKRIDPARNAMIFGLALTGASLALAAFQNVLAFAFILLGVLDNVLVYSLWSKRRSSWNIILGGFSGGLAPLYGWAFVTGTVDVTALILGSIVVLWIPSHIWSLALYHRSDYEKANIPMLPVVVGTETAIRCIASTVILMVGASFALYLYGGFGILYLSVSVITGAVVLGGYLYLFFRPSQELAWTLFKISSPQLFLLFTAAVLDVSLA